MEKPKRLLTPLWTSAVVALLVLGVVVSYYYFNRGSLIEIHSGRFEDMVISRDIGKLVLVMNEQVVEVTLKANALKESKYVEELEGATFDGPHYKLTVSSIDEFEEYYDRITREIPREQRVELRFVERVQQLQMLQMLR